MYRIEQKFAYYTNSLARLRSASKTAQATAGYGQTTPGGTYRTKRDDPTGAGGQGWY